MALQASARGDQPPRERRHDGAGGAEVVDDAVADQGVARDLPPVAEGLVAVAAFGEEAVGGDPVDPGLLDRSAAHLEIEHPAADRASEVVDGAQPRDLDHPGGERGALFDDAAQVAAGELEADDGVDERQRVEDMSAMEAAR